MSTNRVSPTAGWVDTSKLPKGPNGRSLCRQCGQEVPKGKRSFCGQECVDAWVVKTNPTRMREVVFKRDKGVCALCGTDTIEWERVVRAEWARIKQGRTFEDRQAQQRFRETYPAFFSHRTSYWDADHIVPVVEGGGECSTENIRTLCIPCHKQVTRELAARRAEARRPDRDARRAQATEQQRIERELAIGKVRLF